MKKKRVTMRVLRSAVSNGSRLLEAIDARSSAGRRYGDVQYALAQDLGGYDNLSEAMRHTVRSIAGLVVLRETLDSKLLNGGNVDVGDYCRISNSLKNLLTMIGLKRVPKDITPNGKQQSFQEYARKRPVRNIDIEDE